MVTEGSGGRLAGRTALITGAASGIGRATAYRCAKEGAHVLATDIDIERGKAAASEADAEAGGAEFRELDVRDCDGFERLVEAIVAEHGRLDVLVNNAGVAQRALLEETTIEERDRLIEINVHGVWNGCRAALPPMKAAGRGSIVNLASASGLLGTPRLATYSLTKAAVVNFTRALAGEAGPEGIRVNAVCPGTIETPLARAVMADGDDPATARQQAVAAHALRRLGTPEEVAASIVFLASDEASFITGHAMAVDGGSSAVLRER